MNQTQELTSTATLLDRVRLGDAQAKERLVAIYLPLLMRWAKGRLPSYARSLSETQDLVQMTLIRALDNVQNFESHREGAFLAYLRKILMNLICNEIRRPDTRLVDPATNPNEIVDSEPKWSVDEILTYEAALEKLDEKEREGIVLRLEFGLSYGEIAAAMRKPSANAARMFVSRALVNFASHMA